MKIKGGKFFVFLCVTFLLPRIVFAETNVATIAITEIGAYEVTGAEWIEIYNYGTSPVDLTGFNFWEQETNHRLTLFNSDDFLLGPEEYAVIAADASTTLQRYPTLATKIFDSAWGSLKESGELIGLRDAEEHFVEQFVYLPAEDGSLEKIDATLADYSSANWVAREGGNSIGAVRVIENRVPLPEPAYTTSTPEHAPEIVPEITVSSTPEFLPETAVTGTPVAVPETSTTSTPNNEEPATIQNDDAPPLSYTAGTVVINEFVSDPAQGEEWVELYNNSAALIALADWTLQDGAGAVTHLSGTLSAHAFFVIEKPKGALNNAGDLVLLTDGTGKVIDRVAYGNWDDGNKGDNAPAAPDPFSSARYQDGRDSNNDALDFTVTETLTRGMPNIITNTETKKILLPSIPIPPAAPTTTSVKKITPPALPAEPAENIIEKEEEDGVGGTPPQDFSELRITEFLVDPADTEDAEWIEIYNGGEEKLLLDGAVLDDGEGGSRAYVIKEKMVLPAGRHIIFPRAKTRIALNNSGDSVRLFDPFGVLLDTAVYIKAPQGESYALNEGGAWQWTAALTPGMGNTFSEEQAPTAATIKSKAKSTAPKKTTAKTSAKKSFAPVFVAPEDIREKEIGDAITTTGIVSALPGVLGTQIFYIAAPSTTLGIAVYSFKKEFPELAVGDIVSVTGVLSESAGERRIRTTQKEDMAVRGHHVLPLPDITEIHELGEDYVGALIRVQGAITQRLQDKIYIDDGTDELLIFIKEKTGIVTSALPLDARAVVTGILSATKSGLRLLPRSAEDITMVQETAPLKKEAAASAFLNDYQKLILPALIIVAVLLASFLAALLIKNRVKK